MSDKKKGNNSRNVSPVTSRRSRNTSPAMSRRSSVVSWSDSPRDQAVSKRVETVMEDCTESHQAEINKRIRANDKLRKILTNMPDEHESLIYGNNSIGWKFYKNGSRLLRNWMQHTPNRSKLSMKCRFWWPNIPQKMRRLSIRAFQVSSHSHHLPTQTLMHNRPSSQCSNLCSRCKTWGASALLNSSWQLGRQMRKSRKLARSWHSAETGRWGSNIPEPGIEMPKLACWTQSSLHAYLDTAAWISKAKKPSRGVCRTQPQKRDVWRRKCKQEEDVL